MTFVLTENYSVIRRGVAWLAVVRVRWLYEIFGNLDSGWGRGRLWPVVSAFFSCK